MNKKPTKIENIKQLKELAKDDKQVESFIWFGYARSSKSIWHHPEQEVPWEIHNEIDDTFDAFTDKDLLESNIGESITAGTFYQY
jgi:hypothetical protein